MTQVSKNSSTPASATPSPYSMQPGWNNHPSQIPIDPTLQQPQQQQQSQQQSQQQQQHHPPQPQAAQQPPQHYHPGASYYPQYNYAGGYPPPSWSTGQARPPAPPQTHALPPHAPQQQQQQQRTGGELDTADVATLNDALGSAGVDLRAEEEHLRQSHSQPQSQTQASGQSRAPPRRRGKKQGTKVVIDTAHLGARMRTIAARHALQPGAAGVSEDCVAYLALALRVRLSKLVEGMAAAAAHREETSVLRPPGTYEDGTPMWTQVVRRDVAKQLAVLERVEREAELAARRERKTREVYSVGGQAALPSLDDALPMETDEEPKKKKKKPDGPGVTAKNMSEDMKKKLSNAVASQAAGLGTGKYAWMNAGNIPAGPLAKKAAGTASTPTQQTGSGWSKAYQTAKKKEQTPVEEDHRRSVTLRDAIFVVERERGHGGGRGAARGWT